MKMAMLSWFFGIIFLCYRGFPDNFQMSIAAYAVVAILVSVCVMAVIIRYVKD